MRLPGAARLARLPVRVRLTAWYLALLGLTLVALSGFLLLRLHADLIAGMDGSLDARAAEVLSLRHPGDGGFGPAGRAALAGLPPRAAAAQLLSPDGRVVASVGDVSAVRPLLGRDRLGEVRPGRKLRASVRLSSEHQRFRVLAVALDGGGSREILVVASSLDGVDESVDRLQLLLLIAVPAALALAGAGGWLLAGKALWPVARMTRQAGAIGGDQLHERVSVPPARDELAQLASTLNTMLDRIERGVAERRRFLADASHELRTPLAILRAELEVGLRDRHRANGSAELLQSSIEEVDRMSGVVEGLLTLARADEGRLELMPEQVDLGEVASAVVAKLRPMAEAKRIALTLEGDGPRVTADRARILQVTTNLVDNAVSYTAPGGRIQVRVWQTADEAVLSVHDSGQGIAPAALPRVFDRFYRADAGRSRAHGGSGLGLAICKQLVEAHGGRVRAESELGVGSTFAVTLPLRPPRDPR
ncbi:MAG TPA: ATP-binding protein [Actinomycetes bacterium]|jgi:heavy metal sensor kinase|nr:ATP-binding protein [Actinomycetes bacterium]